MTTAAPTSPHQQQQQPHRDTKAGVRDPRSLARLFESMPPHAVEAEMAVLGSLFIKPDRLTDVLEIIDGRAFSRPAHECIFDAMIAVFEKCGTIDIIQLHQRLIDKGSLDAVGGQDYLVQLATSVPSAANAVHYANAVRDKAHVRRAIEIAGELLQGAHHSPDEIAAVIDRATASMIDLGLTQAVSHERSIADLLRERMDRIEAGDCASAGALATGFQCIDEITSGGLRPGEMIVLAARPSMGKTSLALNMAENMAVRGHTVGFVSLEMSSESLTDRLLSSLSGVDSQRMRRNMLGDGDFHRIMAACDELLGTQIFIEDSASPTTTMLRAKARRMKQRRKIDVLFIDYLQLLRASGRKENRQVEVTEISQTVKAIARELEIPVVVLSQLNRSNESGGVRRPRLSDLRESGSIEQDADVVMLLHREDWYHRNDEAWLAANPGKANVAELDIAKQRSGPADIVKLTWIAPTTRFRDWAPERSDAPAAAER